MCWNEGKTPDLSRAQKLQILDEFSLSLSLCFSARDSRVSAFSSLNETSRSRQSRVDDGLTDETRGKSRRAFPDFAKSVTRSPALALSPLRGVSPFVRVNEAHSREEEKNGDAGSVPSSEL
jgi:hypothetical protein